MVLYHAISSYQLLEVMLHRMKYHADEGAVLILPDFIVKKYPQYQKLTRIKWFDEVYLFPYLCIPHTTEKEILNNVSRYYTQILPHAITEFSKIYVAGAHFYFSLYLIENQISFLFFEDAAGMLSRSESLYEALRVKFPVHASIAQKHRLFDGENPYVKRIICLKAAQTKDVSDPKYLNFSVEQALQELCPRKRKKLISFFLRRRLRTRATAILMTQHFSNLGIMSTEEQKHLYTQLRERELSHIRLIIKKHPDDSLDYGQIFLDADVIKEIFPAELLPYVFWKRPGIIYTFDSTGCENLKHHFYIRKLRRELYEK